MNTRILFAGNGFNSLDKNYVSWTELIRRLFKKFGVYDTYLRLFVDKVSPYMQYELLAQAIQSKNGVFSKEDDEKIRKEIADITSRSLEFSSVHEQAVKLYDEIITLNYDSCFETAALNGNKIYPKEVQDNIHRLKVDIPIKGALEGCRTRSVWHPHGAVTEDGQVNSLCMWFQTYIQNVSEIKENLFPCVYGMTDEISRTGEFTGKIESWFQLFFTGNVDIIGTELSYSELDVWWVLSSRAKLIRQGVFPKDFNRIRYFMLEPYDNEKLSEEKISKLALLKSMDIEIVFINPVDYFDNNKIFLNPQNDINLKRFSPAPERSDLYNTEWYYLKSMSVDIKN